MSARRDRRIFAASLVAALGLTAVVFRQATRASFAGDEFAVIALLIEPRSWIQILQRLPSSFYHYIPGAFVFWKAEHAVFGFSSVPLHAVGVALYLLAVTIAAFTLKRFLGPGLRAALTTLLFASFYANYEPVVFLSTAYYTLSLCLMLTSVLVYPTGSDPPHPLRYATFLLFAGLAVFTFEQALVLVPLVVLMEYEEGGFRAALARWRRFVIPAALAVVYLGIWLSGGTASGPVASLSAVVIVKKALISLAYLSCFNLPGALEAYFRGPFAVRVAVTLALTLVVAGLLLRGTRRVRMLVLWALLALAPTLVMQGQKPRYLMFSAVPVTALWSLGIVRLAEGLERTLRARRSYLQGAFALLLTGVLVVGGATFQWGRLEEWVRAGKVMDAFRSASTVALSRQPRPRTVAVVDAPAMSGPYRDVLWPAYLFQSAFNEGSIFRLTPPFVVPETLLLLRTGPVDPVRPVVAEDSVDAGGIRTILSRGGVVFRFRPDMTLQVLDPPG